MMNRAIRPDVALHPSQLRLRIPSGVRPATRFSGAWQPAPVPSLMGDDDDNSLIETVPRPQRLVLEDDGDSLIATVVRPPSLLLEDDGDSLIATVERPAMLWLEGELEREENAPASDARTVIKTFSQAELAVLNGSPQERQESSSPEADKRTLPFSSPLSPVTPRGPRTPVPPESMEWWHAAIAGFAFGLVLAAAAATTCVAWSLSLPTGAAVTAPTQ